MATDHGADASHSEQETRETMQVTIDGVAKTVQLAGLTNFGELMERIEREYVPSGRVVTSLHLNEEPLSMEQEELLYGFGLDNVGTLALHTAEPRALAVESLLHATDYLPELSRALELSASQIRKGHLDDGLEGLDASLELLQHFLAMLDGVRTVLQLDFAKVILDPDEGGSVAKLQQTLDSQVESLLKAAENEDWSAAGEIAAYDLSPLVYQFIAVMPLLVEAALKFVPEYRAEIAKKARLAHQLTDPDAWSDADDISDDDLAEAAPSALEGDPVRTFRAGSKVGHSDDNVTEVLIDDLDEEWEPKRSGKKPAGGDPTIN